MKKFITFLLAAVSLHMCHVQAQPWLGAHKTAIVDEKGHPVILRGVNLGGWLVEEMWMMPFQTQPPEGSDFPVIQDHVSLWKVMKMRFGKHQTAAIRYQLRKMWLAEEDFRNIKEAGCNCVRLPFLYDLVEEEHGTLFEWLDRAISFAGKYGLYVILDMHGCPGRQGPAEHTGSTGHNKLFHHPSDLQRTSEIWEKIAKRYKTEPVVAGFDLINEATGAPSEEALFHAYQTIYKAIRRHDDKHLIFIEDGYKGLQKMLNPHDFDWKQIVYSSHMYPFKVKSKEEALEKFKGRMQLVEKQVFSKEVPYFLGEFNVEPLGDASTVRQYIKMAQEKGISWSIWTYKVALRQDQGSTWGLYEAPPDLELIDPFQDSNDEILRKISLLQTKNFHKNRKLIRAIYG